MKSGLYIAEIVKRLFQSKGMKQAFPDEGERLRHIFAHQVYGLAPTEIIYRIAKRFVLGFDAQKGITEHHLRRLDALPYAKDGTLSRRLDEVFRAPAPQGNRLRTRGVRRECIALNDGQGVIKVPGAAE